MNSARQYLVSLIAILVFILSGCALKQSPGDDPSEQGSQSSNTQETSTNQIDAENINEIDENIEDQTEDTGQDSLDQFVEQVISEATLLRTDAQRLNEEGSLEEAREAYDASLNLILNSGLALDAHPRLAELFKDITRDVVRVEDEITQLENGVETSILVDELDSFEIDDKAIEEAREDLEENTEDTTEKAKPAVTYDIPVVHNGRVEYFINKFTTSRRSAIEEGIKRSGQFIDRFRQILKEEGVPEDLVYLAMIESTFKVRAYSRASAKGIWQFMSWTGKQYGLRIDWWLDERSDPYKACRSAARYLRDLYEQFGDWHLAMASYNGGPGRVGRAVRALGTKDFWKIAETRYLRRETRNFVPSILAAAIIMKNREKYGFNHIVEDKPWEFDTVSVANPIDLRVLAEEAGVSVDDIRNLNPAMRRVITPQGYPNFSLRVPVGTGEEVALKLASIPADKRLKYTEHIIRRGDTLSGIAKRYGSSVSSIQTANNISNPRRLRPGQALVVPLSPGYSPEFSSSTSSSYQKGEKLTHVVRRGDSLYKIARRYGTSVGSIAEWNSMDPYKPIHPGKRLTVYARTRASNSAASQSQPSGSSKTLYTVKQGDTLYDIANKYKISVSSLKRWNNLRRNLIKPGDKLTLYLNDSSE